MYDVVGSELVIITQTWSLGVMTGEMSGKCLATSRKAIRILERSKNGMEKK